MRTTDHRIVLDHPNHGTFIVDPGTLTRAVRDMGSASLSFLRRQTLVSMGLYVDPDWDAPTCFDDCSVIECLIIWIDSGNHPW